MEGYRIENAHFIEFFDRYEDEKSKRQYVNIWCADDDCFEAVTKMIYDQGSHYIRAYHNARTDGHGNAWNGEKWVVPEHFYTTGNNLPHRVDSFTSDNLSTTKSGQNKTWILIEPVEFISNGKIWTQNCFLKRDGKRGMIATECIKNASMRSEASSKTYIKNHPNKNLFAASIIDWLVEDKNA